MPSHMPQGLAASGSSPGCASNHGELELLGFYPTLPISWCRMLLMLLLLLCRFPGSTLPSAFCGLAGLTRLAVTHCGLKSEEGAPGLPPNFSCLSALVSRRPPWNPAVLQALPLPPFPACSWPFLSKPYSACMS
jgi:hypothetical protein